MFCIKNINHQVWLFDPFNKQYCQVGMNSSLYLFLKGLDTD